MKDVFGRLSSHLVFDHFSDMPTEKASHKMRFYAPMSVSFTAEKTRAYYYIPDENAHDRETTMFLRQFGAIEKNGIWTIYFNSSAFADLARVEPFVNIPSGILDGIELLNGHHYFHFRFSNKFTREVSDNVIDLVSDGDAYQVTSFGDNPGLKSYVGNETAGSGRKLRFVRFICSNYREQEYDGFKLPDGTIREFKVHSGANTDRAVYYFPDDAEEQPPNSFIRVSEDHRYYEGPANSGISTFLSTYADGIPLPALSRIQKLEGSNLITEYLLDNWVVELLLGRMIESKKEFPDLHLYIDQATDSIREEEIISS